MKYKNNIPYDNIKPTKKSKDTIHTGKHRKRKKKGLRIIFRISIFILLLFACIFTAKSISDIIFAFLYPETEDLKEQNYPESLIELFDKNPETKDFVLDYPNYKDKNIKINIKKDIKTKKGKIPLFLQWDKRWGYKTYGGDFIAVTGCGPVCLSMVYSGLSENTKWNPYKVAKMAEENGYYVEGSGSSWDLMTSGASKIGLTSYTVRFEKDCILSELNAGNPIICIMGPGDFTTTGHFIVLTGTDENGNVTVNDPNSISNSSKSWKLDEIMPQIRNLWGYTI